MDKYDKQILQQDIKNGIPCHLNHGDRELPLASDYIVQAIGHDGNPGYQVVIPVCKECLNNLQSSEWVLLYCLKCNANVWIYKPTSKLEYYGKHICWQSCCKDCQEENEEVNIFFNIKYKYH